MKNLLKIFKILFSVITDFQHIHRSKLVMLSPELYDFISNMSNDTSFADLILNINHTKVSKQLYFGLGSDVGRISFLPSSKSKDVDDVWNNKYRQEINIGRWAKSLNIYVSDSTIEHFVNVFKSNHQLLLGKEDGFELVSGKDIAKWYLGSNYKSGGGTLNNSCMRYDACQDFFKVYTDNPNVSMLIYRENDKLLGRAIIWHNVEVNKSNTISFMERIYTVSDSYVPLFIAYAKKRGWWYKAYQGTSISRNIPYVSHEGEIVESNLKIKLPDHIEWSKVKMPYMDTFYYLNQTDFNSISFMSGDLVLISDKLQEFIDNKGWGEELSDFIGKRKNINNRAYEMFDAYYLDINTENKFYIPIDCLDRLNIYRVNEKIKIDEKFCTKYKLDINTEYKITKISWSKNKYPIYKISGYDFWIPEKYIIRIKKTSNEIYLSNTISDYKIRYLDSTIG